MMAATMTAGVMGIDGHIVRVEVDITQGLPAFLLVGLAEGAVRESRVRVSSAIRNAGYVLPLRKITANLAPADRRKEGSGFDLPLAVAILGALGHIAQDRFAGWGLAGELSLDGEIHPIPGIFPMALACREAGLEGLIVAGGNAREASLVEGLEVRSARHLRQAAEFMNGTGELPGCESDGDRGREPVLPDLRDVSGQILARRALEIAAAGGHSFLLLGPPGAGKSMLAQRLPSILPPLGPAEAMETTKIWSVAGLLDPASPLITRPPFRAPHHTITAAALAGGGSVPRPGEISLAHNGILFLDELPEFSGRVLDVLRQPLEEGRVLIVRNAHAIAFPSRFMLAAAANPCPCGFLGHPGRECTCTPFQIHRYRSRLSGPLLDRIDLHVDVPPVEVEALDSGSGEPSNRVNGRVVEARRRAAERLSECPSNAVMSGVPPVNAALTPAGLRHLPPPDEAGRRMLKTAVVSYGLSARTYHRLLKVAWTLADLAGSDRVGAEQIGEALQFRVGERDRAALSSAAGVGRRIY